MNPLIPENIAKEYSEKFDQFFDYFSRDIIIHKEPLKVIVAPNVTPLYGYESQSVPENYQYIPVNATFKARISYNKKQNEETLTDLQFALAKGVVTIIVKEPAKDYIENGSTIKIEFDGKTFNKISSFAIRRYLNNSYYQYYLEETK